MSGTPFGLRMPSELKAEIAEAARRNNRSMNTEIVTQLSSGQRSLRDWFAGQALMGMVGAVDHGVTHYQSDSAALAYRYADAMLAERDKGGA